MDLIENCWDITLPIPWSSTSRAAFALADVRLHASVPVHLTPSMASSVRWFQRMFGPLQAEYGIHLTTERLSKMLVEMGEEPETAHQQAFLGSHLTVQGVDSLQIDSLQIPATQVRPGATGPEHLAHFSALHGWALHECADYFLRDMLTPLQATQGRIVSEMVQTLLEHAPLVRSHFRPIADFVAEESSPYLLIAESPTSPWNLREASDRTSKSADRGAHAHYSAGLSGGGL